MLRIELCWAIRVKWGSKIEVLPSDVIYVENNHRLDESEGIVFVAESFFFVRSAIWMVDCSFSFYGYRYTEPPQKLSSRHIHSFILCVFFYPFNSTIIVNKCLSTAWYIHLVFPSRRSLFMRENWLFTFSIGFFVHETGALNYIWILLPI